MVEYLKYWYSPPNLIHRIPNSQTGKLGISKVMIYRIIEQEIQDPDSTPIDVLVIDGKYFVKMKDI